MRKITLYFTTLIAAFLVSTAQARNEIEQSVKAPVDGKVKIKVIDGDVVIKTWAKAEVKVTGELDREAKKFMLETRGDETLIQVEGDHDWRKHGWESNSADLVIFIPTKSSLETSSASADFVVTGVQGSVHTHSASGDIDVIDAGGPVTAQSMSGDIKIVNAKGNLTLSSVSGDVNVSGRVQRFNVNTVSGDVEAQLTKTDLVDFTTVSGDLELELELSDQGHLDAHSVSGDMRFKFTNKSVNARFDIETGPGGDIRNQLSQARSESSFIGAEKMQFETGKNGATVEIRTMSGTIDLRN